MSSAILYLVYGKSARSIAEFKNGYGSGMVLWEAIWIRRLGNSEPMGWRDSFDWSQIKDVAKSGSTPPWMRQSIAWTGFAGRIVPLWRCKERAEPCRVAWDYVRDNCPRYANHWADIAEVVQRQSGLRDHRIQGIGIASSVNDTWANWDGSTPVMDVAAEE